MARQIDRQAAKGLGQMIKGWLKTHGIAHKAMEQQEYGPVAIAPPADMKLVEVHGQHCAYSALPRHLATAIKEELRHRDNSHPAGPPPYEVGETDRLRHWQEPGIRVE